MRTCASSCTCKRQRLLLCLCLCAAPSHAALVPVREPAPIAPVLVRAPAPTALVLVRMPAPIVPVPVRASAPVTAPSVDWDAAVDLPRSPASRCPPPPSGRPRDDRLFDREVHNILVWFEELNNCTPEHHKAVAGRHRRHRNYYSYIVSR